jgi:hypothetical protein
MRKRVPVTGYRSGMNTLSEIQLATLMKRGNAQRPS